MHWDPGSERRYRAERISVRPYRPDDLRHHRRRVVNDHAGGSDDPLYYDLLPDLGGAMQTMGQNGYLPAAFAKLNKHGVPVRGLLVIFAFNMFLILLGTPIAILTASAFGYTFATGITLFAYFKAKNDPEMSKRPRAFKAPRGYKWVALAVGIFDVPFLLIGIGYLYASGGNYLPVTAGAGVLLIYIPIWWYSRREYAAARKEKQQVVKAEPGGPTE